jgi:hypothetical protein
VYPYYEDGIAMAMAMDGGTEAATKDELAPKEDSFGTNNQVSARRINTLFPWSNLLFSSLQMLFFLCRSTV